MIDSISPQFNASSGQIDGKSYTRPSYPTLQSLNTCLYSTALEYTQSANLLCAIAIHDSVVGNATNENIAANYLEVCFQVHPGYYEAPVRSLHAPSHYSES